MAGLAGVVGCDVESVFALGHRAIMATDTACCNAFMIKGAHRIPFATDGMTSLTLIARWHMVAGFAEHSGIVMAAKAATDDADVRKRS